MPSFLPCSVGGKCERNVGLHVRVERRRQLDGVRWTMAPVLSRMIRPIVVIPSPVALDGDRVGVLALRQNGLRHARRRRARASDEHRHRRAEPGWRSTSTAVAVIVMRPRSGALTGMRATAVKVTSRGLVVYTWLNEVSNLVGQLASPCTRMSMRPTPFGCWARAETFKPTPAGMLSPFVGETIGHLGAGDDVDATRRGIGAAVAGSSRSTTTAQAIERRVGGVDRLQVSANRRVAESCAKRPAGIAIAL